MPPRLPARPTVRGTTGLAVGVTAGLIASSASAQWVEFENETSTRLIADPVLVVDDNLEKDIDWGDFDQDGDIDIIVARKFPGSIEGGFSNYLLMNEGGVLVDRTDELGVASDIPGDLGLKAPTNDRDIRVADIDGDGWLDLVTATTMSDGVDWTIGQPRVYMNLGLDGSNEWLGFRHERDRIPQLFAKNGSVANPRFCDQVVADFNGDGYPDIFYTDYDTPETSGTICIDLNGDGDTNDPGECQQSPAESSTRDFDNKLLINWGDTEGGPGPGYFYDTETDVMTSSQLAAAFGNSADDGDFNNDGTTDIVRINTLTGGQDVAILYNDPADPGFSWDGPDQVTAGAPYFVTAGDLNNDGWLDLVVTDDGRDKFLLNQGNGGDGFANWISYTINDSASEFGNTSKLADLDNDGDLDVMIADVDADVPPFCPLSNRRARIYRNTGGMTPDLVEDGTVLPTNSLLATYDFAPVDLNGDGWLDLVMCRCAGIEVWMNKPPFSVEISYPEGIPSSVEPGTPTDVIVALEAIGRPLDASSPALFTSIDGAPFIESPLVESKGNWVGTLPALACGETLAWYVSAALEGGGSFTDPSAAPAATYGLVAVTGNEMLLDTGFEIGADGFTATADPDTNNGAWERAVPVATISGGDVVAPGEDASSDGTIAWVTQNGLPGASAGVDDIDGGPVYLTSPVIDLSSGDAVVSFAAWFYCNDAAIPAEADRMWAEVTNDGENWFEAWETTGTSGAWETFSFRVGEVVVPTATVQFRFVAADQPNNSLTEAGIDDVVVDATVCEETSCPGDVNGDGIVDGADLGILLGAWGTDDAAADIDGSGIVEGVDLGILLGAFGGDC